MSEHQAKKKRKAQRSTEERKQKEKKPRRDFRTAMHELWSLEDNKFFLICVVGLVIILFSTSLPGRIGLLVQTAIAALFVIGCIIRPLIRIEPAEKTEEENSSEENT